MFYNKSNKLISDNKILLIYNMWDKQTIFWIIISTEIIKWVTLSSMQSFRKVDYIISQNNIDEMITTISRLELERKYLAKPTTNSLNTPQNFTRD